jgi:hypothetical protein
MLQSYAIPLSLQAHICYTTIFQLHWYIVVTCIMSFISIAFSTYFHVHLHTYIHIISQFLKKHFSMELLLFLECSKETKNYFDILFAFLLNIRIMITP